ncbi:MAG: MgtC/SapB family protein [Granulosicoccaceae bacterium]|jgi:uncharacterized membrane protein (DUF4010 family)
MDIAIKLVIALGIGLLIGTERGWQARDAAEGSRVAGIRTFGLIGLLGALWALLAEQLGDILLGIAFATLAAIMLIAYLRDTAQTQNVSITSVVAALITFVLGALCVRNYEIIAASTAVVVTLLLGLKPVLHGWLQRIKAEELFAGLKLLLISVVLLPVLPDKGYGPWQALNPYEIWWLVVLIAGMSFSGYIAMKIAGVQRGILYTGLFGGLVSSTAVTLNLSRLAKTLRNEHVLAAGILVACATMYPRILIEVGVVNRAMLPELLLPMLVMTVITYAGAAWTWQHRHSSTLVSEVPLRNPMELGMAIRFGLLLVAVILLVNFLHDRYGQSGVYVLAIISGLFDVDAITLSLARLAKTELASAHASLAIVMAAISNSVVKALFVISIAGRRLGTLVALIMGIAIIAVLVTSYTLLILS